MDDVSQAPDAPCGQGNKKRERIKDRLPATDQSKYVEGETEVLSKRG